LERGTLWWSPANRLEVEVLAATQWCVTFRLVGRDTTERARHLRVARGAFEQSYVRRDGPEARDDGAARGTRDTAHSTRRAA
jgi:hypothetical protein